MKSNIFQEADGSYSMRRLLAFLSWIAGAVLAFVALPYTSVGWYVFVPSLAFLTLAVVLPILTTLTDLKTIAEAFKGMK
jgi:hypothetical protein